MQQRLPIRVVLALAVSFGLLGCTANRVAGQTTATDPAAAERLAVLKRSGPQTTLTIFPVFVLGRPDRNVANAVGLILEKAGMTNLDAVDAGFTPPSGTTWDDTPAHFAEFIAKNPIKAEYALYAEYLGEPKGGPTEVRFLVTDAKGQLVFQDRQTPKDSDFRKTAGRDPDPMGCSMLVAERLFSELGWKKSQGPSEGKFARIWAEKSGTPAEADRKAMKERLATFKSTRKTATIEIHATVTGDASDPQSATRISRLVNERIGSQMKAANPSAAPKIAPSSNEQKRLWDLARAFRDYVRANPPASDYAMITDVLFNPQHPSRGAVHVVVCDKTGDWVIVDFCNDQHDDWQKIAPKTVEDVERLAAERVAILVR